MVKFWIECVISNYSVTIVKCSINSRPQGTSKLIRTWNTHMHIRPHTFPLCFVSQKPQGRWIPNLACICNVIRQSYYIITPRWYDAILVMQMKVKGQISFCYVSQESFVRLSPNFVCIWNVTRQPNGIIRWNWYKAVLVMQMKVKGQISFCFVSQEPLVQLSPNLVCIWIVTR